MRQVTSRARGAGHPEFGVLCFSLAFLPMVEPRVLAGIPWIPSGCGGHRSARSPNVRRRSEYDDALRDASLDGRLCGDRLPEDQLQLSALRRDVLSGMGRSPLPQDLAAKPVCEKLPTLWLAQVGQQRGRQPAHFYDEPVRRQVDISVNASPSWMRYSPNGHAFAMLPRTL